MNGFKGFFNYIYAMFLSLFYIRDAFYNVKLNHCQFLTMLVSLVYH